MMRHAIRIAALCGAMACVTLPAQAALVGYWNFNETAGSIANASVGTVNGSLSGGAEFVAGGIEGGAVRLDEARNGFVDFGDNFAFTSGSFSVQVWVKTTQTTGGMPVSRHTSGNVSGYFLSINNIGAGCGGDGGKVLMYVAYPCSPASSVAVNDATWHQLVGVYDSTTTKVAVYVDGVLQGFSAGGNANNPTPPGTSFLVGGITSLGVPLGNYTGLIDELRVYDHALSADEVMGLYTALTQPATGVSEPGTLALLGFGAAALGVARRARRR